MKFEVHIHMQKAEFLSAMHSHRIPKKREGFRKSWNHLLACGNMLVILFSLLESSQTVWTLTQAVVSLGQMCFKCAALAECWLTHRTPEFSTFMCELVFTESAFTHKPFATQPADKRHLCTVELAHVARQNPLRHWLGTWCHRACGHLGLRRLEVMG